MTSTGADIPAAFAEFRRAGFQVTEIATDLGVHPSSVYRWGAGTRTPNRANFAALRQLVRARHSQHVHRRALTAATLHLQEAIDALQTTAERAERDEIATRVAATLAGRDRSDQVDREQRRARFAQRRDARRIAREHVPYQSITSQADPFAVCQAGPSLLDAVEVSQ